MKKSAAQLILVLCALALCQSVTSAKTIYIHLVEGNDNKADGTYSRPFKSWRIALQHVTGGDTIIATNGDYRTSGAAAK
jgi:hypothetical protein